MRSKASAPILHEHLPLVEVADKLTLDLLLADPQARTLILTRLSDTVAAVAPQQFDALLARLRKLGHTPKVQDG